MIAVGRSPAAQLAADRTAIFMLPTISIKLDSICHSARKFHEPSAIHYIGQAYSFNLADIQNHLTSSSLNLDELLSKHILYGISREPIKSRAIFWYAAATGLIVIFGCEKNLRAQFNWLRDIPGYYDSGQDYVPAVAKPFMFWDGKNLFRIYEHPFVVEEDVTYVCDFGDLTGLKLIAVKNKNWEIFAKQEMNTIYFSKLPDVSDQVVDIVDARYLIRHSWFIVA